MFSLPFLFLVPTVVALSNAEAIHRVLLAALVACGHNQKTAAHSIGLSEAQFSRSLQSVATGLARLFDIDPDYKRQVDVLWKAASEPQQERQTA